MNYISFFMPLHPGHFPRLRPFKIPAAIVAATLLLAACYSERPGTSGDDGVAVDPVSYCIDRCALKAEKEVTECDIFQGTVTEQQIYDMCFVSLRCSEPSLCEPICDEADPALCPEGSYWRPFVSSTEAEECLDALRMQACDDLGQVPPECHAERICDPR